MTISSGVSPGAITSQSQVRYRCGGREYNLRTVRQCKVCNSPYRFAVEEQLIGGRSYRKIAEHLPEDSDLSWRNVKDHFGNGHLPLEQSASREIIEARAQQIGKNIETGVESLVDGISMAQVIVQKTFEALARGDLTVDIRDGMTAAKFLADLGEYDEGGTDMAAITEAFIVYHETAQDHMTQQQFEAFGNALNRSPVLKALVEQHNGRHQTVAGEVEEEESV